MDVSIDGRRTLFQIFYIWNQQRYQKNVKFLKIKMGVAGLMFEPHPPNLKIYTTFKDVQVTLKPFFDISTGFRY